MGYMVKKEIYTVYLSEHNSKHEETSYSFNDSKRRRMALSCSKETISNVKKNNFKK